MSDLPNDLKYTESHEWVKRKDDGMLVIGVTDHAQHLLGDMVFVELPETGITVNAGDECGVLESVKAASDLYSPVAGEIVEVNEALVDSPATINSDPFGEGWIFILKPNDINDIDALLDATTYAEKTTD